MPDRGKRPTAWSEAEVETLLRDFFRRELPANLPLAPPHHSTAAPAPLTAADRTRRAGAFGLGIAALVLLLGFAALYDDAPRDARHRRTASDQPTARRERPSARNPATGERPLVIELTEPPGTFVTSEDAAPPQPVESQPRSETPPARRIDPDTGMEVQPPEFQIEVYPIEDK